MQNYDFLKTVYNNFDEMWSGIGRNVSRNDGPWVVGKNIDKMIDI